MLKFSRILLQKYILKITDLVPLLQMYFYRHTNCYTDHTRLSTAFTNGWSTVIQRSKP